MDTLKLFDEACAKDPLLKEKYQAEYFRVLESSEAANETEAAIKAAKAVGYEINYSDFEKASAQMEELDSDALDQVAGGAGVPQSTKCNIGYTCNLFPRNPSKKDAADAIDPNAIDQNAIDQIAPAGKKLTKAYPLYPPMDSGF